ncbi:Protein-lysine methyltransferase METTL21C [Hondaea fermentalgiana]|uniref:Protein-lysine methyltransferase METTL21C n=1 Tax=Hondaea fermentalgiana TaxID=2315210 RepID=A0A2R5GZL5_9STRA|nr:Protein-lysine methyltransferase METTL21C [Hondaea fermentalgiana]|eukprot:GBG34213.1 Protein-lysine methyltransferase METTL21C [Hondaea fermentalgiana]
MAEEEEMELPELAESEVPLAAGGLPAEEEEGEERAQKPARIVKLVHLRDPKAGVFSQAKKQFFWGTSLLTASFVNALDLSAEAAAGKDIEVLEIGGGSGLCSLTAALVGAASVRMTDLVPDALRVCEKSAAANALSNITFAKLDWNAPETVPESAFDLVIGSDILFYRGTVAPVARAFAQALRPGGIGILSDPCRCNTDDFIAKLEELGIVAETHLFRPRMLARGRDLGPKAFVNVKKVKLIVFRRPLEETDATEDAHDILWAQVQAALPKFTRPELEVELEALGLAPTSS